ncbi:MAG: 50S ribosomal protein L4 [Bdellovibrionales bacterium]|jgi:large subunit ribosomal protein L4|nr:50S ribosomal protein L4 [Bdellovibrionales bacterium]MBL7669456.1 50S ribosomal protein L4 [Pseudobdellovibrionaceae bacterium]
MAKVDVLNWKKEKVGQIELAPEVFDIEVRLDVLHTVVRWQLASRRQGTHSTKTKGLVSGGGKKPFKQKGTGNARQGSIRSPLMPGGGTAFGPLPRDYSYALPKKVRKLGLAMALSQLLKDGKLVVLDDVQSNGKTKDFAEKMKAFGLEKAVFIDEASSDLAKRAAKNLPKVKYLPVAGANVFDVLKYEHVVLAKNAVEGIVNKCLMEKA